MLRKYMRVLAALLAALMLAGCGEPEPQETTNPIQTNPTVSTQPTLPTNPTDPIVPTDPESPDPPEPPEPPEPLPELDALKILTCVEFDAFPELLSLGDGLVVASRNTYSELQGRINETLIIDLFQDEVVARSVRAHSMELVTQKFADGSILLGEPDSSKFFVFDRELAVTTSISVPNLDGFFSYDRSCYYYIQESVLYSMNVSSGQSVPATLERTLRMESLVGIDPQRNVLVARVYLDSQTTDYGVAVINADTGKLLLLRADLTHVWLNGDDFTAVEMGTAGMGFDVYYGSLIGGDICRITSDKIHSSSVSYTGLIGSDYLLWRYDPDAGVKATKIYDLAAGTVAELSQLSFDAALFSPVYLPHEQGILGYYSIKEPKTAENPYPKEKLQLALINPSKLTYTQGPAAEEAPWQECTDGNAVSYD